MTELIESSKRWIETRLADKRLTALWNVGETLQIDASGDVGCMCDVAGIGKVARPPLWLTSLSASQGYGWSSCVREVDSAWTRTVPITVCVQRVVLVVTVNTRWIPAQPSLASMGVPAVVTWGAMCVR